MSAHDEDFADRTDLAEKRLQPRWPDLAVMFGTAQGNGWSTRISEIERNTVYFERGNQRITILLTDAPMQVKTITSSLIQATREITEPLQLLAILENQDERP